MESNDAFCASCHLEPETTYYEHSLEQGRPPTLAALHAGAGTRCIDCHSGRWIPGRMGAQWIGLQNLIVYHSSEITQPAQTTQPVGDAGCTKCHENLNWVRERPGHYHSPVLRRQWQARGGPPDSCAACHAPHEVANSPQEGFLDEEGVEEQCEACHDS